MHAPVVLVADYAGTFQVDDTTELRARVTQPTGAGSTGQPIDGGIDFFTQPGAHVRITDRRWECVLSYMPSLTVPIVSLLPEPVLVLNIGKASVAWHDRFVRVGVTEDATYGTYSSANLLQPTQSAGLGPSSAPPTTPPSLQVAPAPKTLTILNTRTEANVTATFARSSLFLGVSYAVSGGLGSDSQMDFPQERGPRADGSFSYSLSRRDQLVTLAYAQRVEFSEGDCVNIIAGQLVVATDQTCAPQDDVAQVSEEIRHAVERQTLLTLGAGATVADVREDPRFPYHRAWFPNANASLNHAFGEKGTGLTLDARLAAAIDPRTGYVSNRMQGLASLAAAVSSHIAINVTAAGFQTIPTTDPLSTTMVTGGADVTFLAGTSKWLQLALGGRAAWQNEGQLGGGFFSALGFFSVTVRAPALRF